MSLEATGVEAIERCMSAEFSLPMRDGERTVTIVVTHEALKAFDPGTPTAAEALRNGARRVSGAIEIRARRDRRQRPHPDPAAEFGVIAFEVSGYLHR